MKTTSTLRNFLLIAGSSLMAISSATAATYYWDQNSTTAGFGTAGGTWDAIGSSTWNLDPLGGSAGTPSGIQSTATTTSDALNFGTNTATYGLADGTINVGTVEAASLTYGSQSGAILLSGGSINFGAAATITNSSAVNQIISSTITGAGTSLTKSGTTVRLSATNSSYTGATIISGILEVTKLANGGVGNNSSIGASTNAAANLTLNANATLRYIGSTESTTDRLIQTNAAASGNRFMTLDASGAGAIKFTNSGNLFFSSAGGAREVILTGTSTADNTLGFSLTNVNTGTGYLDVTKRGSGTWILTGANTNRDAAVPGTTMPKNRTYSVEEGLLIFRTAQSMENVGVLELNKNAVNDSILELQNDTSVTLNYAGIRVQSTTGNTLRLGRINAGSGDGLVFTMANTEADASRFTVNNGALIVQAGANINAGTTPTLDISGAGVFRFGTVNGTQATTIDADTANVRINGTSDVQTLDTRNITLKGSTHGNEIYGGVVAGSNIYNFTKDGTGTWTFSGANTHSSTDGTYTVLNGTLKFAKQVSLYNNNTADWTAANIRVRNGGTLALNVGGPSGEFTTGDVTTLLGALGGANGTSTNGFAAGSTIGFDTTNASGTFTVGDVIANSSGSGGGAIGLTKLGSGTLELTNANTYTGATTVSAGTLVVNGNQIGATGDVSVGSGLTNTTAVRLKGTGTVGGNTTFAADPDGAGAKVGGIHSPGASVGKQTFDQAAAATTNLTYNSGSIFEWELAATPAATVISDESNYASNRGTAYDAVNVTGTVTGSGAIFRIVLDGTQTFGDGFWSATRTWTDIFRNGDGTGTVNVSDWASVFSGGFQYYNYSGDAGALASIAGPTGGAFFSLTGSTLTYTAIPEPSTALAGLLLTAGLLRRRRK